MAIEKKYIVDTTLRDGEQSPGIAFTLREKVSIAKALDKMGISRIEAGVPAMGQDERRAFEKIKLSCEKAEIVAWNRMNLEDIQASIDCGADIIHICVPASTLLIKEKLRKTNNVILEMIEVCADTIHKANKIFTIGLEDASRADWFFVEQIIQKAKDLKASTIRFADTVGILTPGTCNDFVKKLNTGIDLEIHMHNDLGMAVANSVSGTLSGAKYIDCTLFGIGERAGNCNLEHFLEVLDGQFNFGISLENLRRQQTKLKPIIFKTPSIV
ncbi:hypothetical protein [Acetobacterium bakii]|uniref:Pyruvate carboxyltransferase domain-containing protein n=1 Tax=Acetobacterium bakii TaxID=52689 RepID=A0A0L6U0E3_9FIRM|nr:hypothetical protein [Acetobacterium bakii]KNZ41963.1 hypothetical protein AKG39_10160 [Acetobacterium bakii]